MVPDNNEELNEEYDDELLQLMLEEYLEREGNRILEELEEAEANGELPEVPPELDARCRKMIADARANGRRREWFARFTRTAGRVAAILVVTVGLLTTLVFSVDALRVPVVNFVIEQYEKYSSIYGQDDEAPKNPALNITKESAERALEAVLPDGYEMIFSNTSDDGTFKLAYKGDNNEMVFFNTYLSSNLLNIDTENANSKTISIGLYDGMLIKKDTSVYIYWEDSEVGLIYQLYTENLNESTAQDFAQAMLEQIMGVKK